MVGIGTEGWITIKTVRFCLTSETTCKMTYKDDASIQSVPDNIKPAEQSIQILASMQAEHWIRQNWQVPSGRGYCPIGQL
jgi:hypothetical protein